MNEYNASTRIRLKANFFDVATNAAADPTTIAVKVLKPSGTIVDLTSVVVHVTSGEYTADYIPDVIGEYTYEFIGTGVVQVPGIKKFNVLQATF